VAGFSRVLRFKEFHGLVGKPNAAQKRDEVFRGWLSEAVLNHQVEVQGMLSQPRFATMASRLERDLVLQETLRVLLEADFAPTDAEVEAYYQEHLAEFTPAPRVKMGSLKVANAEAAAVLRTKILDGTPVTWLKSNDKSVVQGPSPFPEDYFAPHQLGLSQEEVKVGWVPEPYQVPSGWVVAVVTEVEEPLPTPLASCRNELLAGMKAEQTRNLMNDILAQLEAATPVTVLPGAEANVKAVVEDFFARQDAAATDPQSPAQEG
jgi:hypothetical protein